MSLSDMRYSRETTSDAPMQDGLHLLVCPDCRKARRNKKDYGLSL